MAKYPAVYETSYTTEELIYRLFKKKICPVCGGKMIQVKKKIYLATKRPNLGGHGEGISDIYCMDVYYYCKTCDKEFPIGELAKLAKGDK
jgi:hypothetical protein